MKGSDFGMKHSVSSFGSNIQSCPSANEYDRFNTVNAGYCNGRIKVLPSLLVAATEWRAVGYRWRRDTGIITLQ